MELLAPAGSYAALVAAVQAGANAVYLGGKEFGARHYASNFSLEELKEAIDYCHLRNVPIYVTVNILIHDDEMKRLKLYLMELSNIGVDGIIVQDLAVAKVAREVASNLELHGSTQLTIHNLKSALYFEKLGFSKIVLARELSLNEIRTICAGTDLDIEIFIHGALCICYSGQCLLSSLIGGRSGNRGKCAQPCRLPYQLEKDGKKINIAEGQHLLSPRDLNFIEYLEEFREMGVASLKIEGRMKSPEYVATVVNAYRQALDKIEISNDKDFLSQIFHRRYSNGYLEGFSGKQMMSVDRPNNHGEKVGIIKLEHGKPICSFSKAIRIGDQLEIRPDNPKLKSEIFTVTENPLNISNAFPENTKIYRVSSTDHLQWVKDFLQKEQRFIPLKMTVQGEAGKPLHLTITDVEQNEVTIFGTYHAMSPEKHELTKELLTKQLGRLGNTPFILENLTYSSSAPLMVPISELNQLRREGVEKLMNLRLNKYNKQFIINDKTLITAISSDSELVVTEPKIQVQVANNEQAKIALLAGADQILFEGDFKNDLKKAIELSNLVKNSQKEFILGFPRIVPEENIKLYENTLNNDLLANFNNIELSGPAFLKEISAQYPSIKISGGFSLNIFNKATFEEYLQLGFEKLTLSPELTFKEITQITKKQGNKAQIIVHGFQEVMVSKFCLLGAYLGNRTNHTPCTQPCKKGSYSLRDRKNEHFKIHTDENCLMQLLNGKELSMLPFIHDLKNTQAAVWRIDGRYLNNQQLTLITEIYKKQERFSKEQEKHLLSNDITRGHYFRGVE